MAVQLATRNSLFAASGQRSRRGFSLVEALLASLLAFVAAAIWAGMHEYQARQDRDVDSRIAALDEARGVMERLRAKPFRDLAPGPGPMAVPPSLPFPPPPPLPPGPATLPPPPPGPAPEGPFRKLPGAQLTVHVHPYADGPAAPDPAALEIDVIASWHEDGNRRELRLVSVRTDNELEDLP